MEEKNVTKISLSTFLLILAIIAIIVMGIFIYKLDNDKTAEIQKSAKLQSQVNSLNGTVSDLQEKINSIVNTINDTELNDDLTLDKKENISEIDDIVLDDIFAIENSDAGYKFTKNGTVEFIANTSGMDGTYHTVNKNEIEIHFNKETICEDMENTIIKDIEIVAKCIIKDERNLYIEYQHNGIEYQHNVVKVENN